MTSQNKIHSLSRYSDFNLRCPVMSKIFALGFAAEVKVKIISLHRCVFRIQQKYQIDRIEAKIVLVYSYKNITTIKIVH